MSLLEPKCMVCGAPLDKSAPFKKKVRDGEVCSDECYGIYMYGEDEPHPNINEDDWRRER